MDIGETLLPANDRAELYANSRGLTIEKQLGGGFDGVVLGTGRRTAVKSLNQRELYWRELAVYIRLRDRGVHSLRGFQIPRLIDQDDRLAVIEMTVVSPPFVLDFAGARLDQPSDFPEDVMADWIAAKREQFESDWPLVRSVIRSFETLGIYLNDVHPGNVACR